jgi:DNA-binding response OmpR family regulator
MRILLVEDDNDLAHALAVVLSKQHYVVDIAADGETGWELVGVCNYDLILLDVMLPKLDGISLCRQLRSQGYQMPILLLTAKDTRTDKVMGLDGGADDYVVKPFDFQVLTARIRALLRRGNTTLPPVLEWENLRLDPSSCEVTYNDKALHLTAKEFSILELFLRNSQRTFSRSAIIDKLWGAEKDPPEDDTIKSHIKSLRQKLKAAGANYDFIETVYGLGYRLKPLSPETSYQTNEIETSLIQQQTLLTAVAKAREDFTIKVGNRIAVLEQAANVLKQGKLDAKLQHKAEQEAHKLAGALGSFGFDKGSKIAAKIENLLKTHLDKNQVYPLNKLLRNLQRELQLNSQERPKLILIFSEETQLIEQVVKEVSQQGIIIKIVPDIAAARNYLENYQKTFFQPDGVLINLNSTNGIQDSLNLLADLSHATPPIPAMVFADNFHSMNTKLEIIYSWVGIFSQDNTSSQCFTTSNNNSYLPEEI